jgi:Zn-dependent alcohol dehydrogenase
MNIAGRRPDGASTIESGSHGTVNGCFFYQSSFADFALAHRRNVVKVRSDAPLEILGPLGCGIQTGAGAVLNVFKPGPSASVAIFGAGAVGLSALMAAKLLGCKRIVAVDRVPSQLELALQLGATQVVDSSEVEVGKLCARLGAIDFSIEATGGRKYGNPSPKPDWRVRPVRYSATRLFATDRLGVPFGREDGTRHCRRRFRSFDLHPSTDRSIHGWAVSIR